ncbi:MAG: hypothetical protein ABSG92_08425 [Conexivisphaerales archaeon]
MTLNLQIIPADDSAGVHSLVRAMVIIVPSKKLLARTLAGCVELQEEVMRYLSVRKDLTEYIRDGLKLAQTQLDQVESDIKRVQARFPA